MLCLERAQLPHQQVELRVGDAGLVEHEVAMLVLADLLPQLLHSPLHILCAGHRARLYFAADMRRAALIYNPTSGRRRPHRLRHVTTTADTLRAGGVDAVLIPTSGPGAATQLARQAIADGFDTILACGGDGTMNEILQAVVHTQAALGVVPTGTVNVLARDIGLPFTAEAAARALLASEPCRLAVGRIEFTTRAGAPQTSYFTVMAGVGVDAQLPYRVDLALKKRIGIFAYAVEALRIVFKLDFAPQVVTFTDAAGN